MSLLATNSSSEEEVVEVPVDLVEDHPAAASEAEADQAACLEAEAARVEAAALSPATASNRDQVLRGLCEEWRLLLLDSGTTESSSLSQKKFGVYMFCVLCIKKNKTLKMYSFSFIWFYSTVEYHRIIMIR